MTGTLFFMVFIVEFVNILKPSAKQCRAVEKLLPSSILFDSPISPVSWIGEEILLNFVSEES